MRVKHLKSNQQDVAIDKKVNKFLDTLPNDVVVSIVITPESHNHYVSYATIVYRDRA